MVELDVLAALDGIQWLRTGEEVARRFGISQPTVSRYVAKALEVFGLELKRVDGEWELSGDQTFLRMEREVHQVARRMGYGPLRLEAAYWSAPTLCQSLPEGWILGQSNIVGIRRNLALVRDRVIDGWIAGLPDLPDGSDSELVAIVLSKMPVFFTCAPGHPLLKRPVIGYKDIAEYPSLALPSGAYPKVEVALKSIGLWSDAVRMARYRRDKWEGKSESELVVGYGTPLSMEVSGGQLCRLPLTLPFESGDALVVSKDFVSHSRLSELVGCLRSTLQNLSRRIEGIEVVC